MSTEIRVPTLGESVTEATVATWFKKPGETVAVDEMLCELETDKVTVEVPSPSAGKLTEIVAGEGDTVGVDALLATLEEGASGEAPAADPEPAPAAPASNGAAPAGDAVDVMVPTLGESVAEATVASWFKAPGDTVAADEILCELETDKVSVEVPAPSAGVLSEIVAAEGSTVEAGGKLAVMAPSGSAAPAPKAEAPAPAAAPAATGKDVEDAPSAKKMMAENNLSADAVTGTGK
ncbi:MAG: biotin/lipoyl-containing protein, partial [Pseudomonadota bacterium]